MTSTTPNLDNLREHVIKLNALLDDPHPSLMTWRQCDAEHMQAISDFWNDEPKEPR